MKFFLLFFFLLGIVPIAHAAIVINEIFPKPSDETSEWIELYNNGSDSVSLDRWKLQNTQGTPKTFIMNASSIIQPNNFLILFQSQTGINLQNEGDSVQLIDANGSPVDSQSYPGILGYNTSMGRSVDGVGSWTICTTPATPNKPNNCPTPSITPTSIPISTSTNTPIASFTPIITSTPTPIFVSASLPQQSQVLGVSNPSDKPNTRWCLGAVSFFIAGAAGMGLIARWHQKK